jgi:putative aldouronate transport system permease protein
VLSASLSNPEYIVRGEVWLLPKGINLEAYIRVFRDENIITGYANSLLYTVVGTLLNVVITIFGAYPLSRKDLWGQNFFMKLFLFTMFFSGGLIPTYLLIKNLGLLNSFWVMILPGAVSMWNLIIMRTFFQTSIPYELQEAAFIDGCSNISVLVRIILPLSLPIIAVSILFYAVGHWNAYFNALIYLNDNEKFPLQLVLRQILLQNDVGKMTETGVETESQKLLIIESLRYAIIIVASVPVLLIYPFIQRYFVKGVMIGAIKG